MEKQSTDLKEMKNIGSEMRRKLISVGISSAEDLAALGAKQAFVRLKEAYPQVCLVHLYALAGAVGNTDYNRLASEQKKELKDFSDRLRFGVGSLSDEL